MLGMGEFCVVLGLLKVFIGILIMADLSFCCGWDFCVITIAVAWNVDDLMPPAERFIFNFNSKEELKKWHLYSDSEYGGM